MMSAADESWEAIVGLLPSNWQEQAVACGAVKRLRGFDSASSLLRTLLMHVGRGYSLRETAVRAGSAGLAKVSDVALLKRLRAAEQWWQGLCLSLLAERGVVMRPGPLGRRVRILDGSIVKEPGRTGSQFRLHYSLQVPSMLCDHIAITAVQGQGTGEKLHRFPARSRDLILADRGFCNPVGLRALIEQGADVIVRLNTGVTPLLTMRGTAFHLADQLSELKEVGPVREWQVAIPGAEGRISGRICAIRKGEEATRRSLHKIKRRSQKGGPAPKPETLQYARFILVFTTLESRQLSGAEVLEWYRLRWQVELVFKRLKSLAQLGHLPKYDEQSSRAWLYGKLLVALLSEKLIRVGRSISPWGYLLPQTQTPQSLAGL
jgi:Transposase DDE domain